MSNEEMLNQVLNGAGLEALDNLAIRSPRSGKVVARGGLRVSLKFKDGHTTEKRLAMVAMWRSYYETFVEHLTHWQKPDSTRLIKLQHEFPPFEHLAKEGPSDKHFSGVLWGFPAGGQVNELSKYYISGIGIKALNADENSYVDAHIPVSWAVSNGWGHFRELVQHWCDILSPVHGTAGLSLLFEPAMGQSYLQYAYGLLKRFPGLDYEEPGRWSNQVRENVHKIRTTNWLTVLGDPLIDELNGREIMREKLGGDCPLFDYGGGTIIQAGEEPELGDLNFGFVPETYRKVAQLTKPLRFEGYRSGALAGVPKPLDNLEETRTWIARFD